MTTRRTPWPAVAAITATRVRRPSSAVASPGKVTITRLPSRKALSGTACGTSLTGIPSLSPCSGSVATGLFVPSSDLWVSS